MAFWNTDSEKDGALSGIAAHLQGRRHTFTDYGVLARKDAMLARKTVDALARKTTHFWDCGELGTIAVRPSKCSAHDCEKSGAHMPYFLVRVRRVCFILFDAYRMPHWAMFSYFLIYFIMSFVLYVFIQHMQDILRLLFGKDVKDVDVDMAVKKRNEFMADRGKRVSLIASHSVQYMRTCIICLETF